MQKCYQMNTPVTEWDEVMKRRVWTLVQAYFAPVVGQKIPIRGVGRSNAWYASRASDTLDDFVTCSWDQLLHRTSFGRKKLDLLLAILVEAIEHETGQPLDLNKDSGSTRASELSVANPAERLVELGIPPGFPLRFCRLSRRVLNFCTSSNTTTIPALMELFRRDGEAGLLRRLNLGRKSVAEIAGLCAAIEQSIDADLIRYLPYDIEHRKLSFSAAITGTIQALEPDERLILTRRLVEQQTFDELGLSAGISRARAWQIEANFLANISAAFEWFQTDKERLFERLRSHHSIDDLLTGIDALDRALAVKAIATAFWQTPEGRVATEETDERFSACADEIRNSPAFYFGEISLRAFLESKDRVPSSAPF
jgi:Sigma-70, region 4